MNIETLLPEFIVHLRDERQLAQNTITTYRSDLIQFNDFTDGKSFAEIDLSDFRAYMRHLKDQGLKASTTRRKLHCLSTFWAFQVVIGNAISNLPLQAQRIAPRRKQTVQKKLLTKDQWYKFANTPSENVRDNVAWGLLAWLGIRNHELRSIRIRDVNLDENILLIVNGKGGNERLLPLPEELTDGIRALIWKHEPGEFLLRGEQGGFWSKDSFHNAFRHHLERCDLPAEITPHWLRHTVATHMSDNMNVFELRAWLGHKSTRTTELYVHHNPARLRTGLDNHFLSEED